jgi:hypothetical protein
MACLISSAAWLVSMMNLAALALQCGVLADHGLLEAIVRVESRGNPFAVAVNGDVELVREPRSREEAVAMARWLQRHGYNFINASKDGQLAMEQFLDAHLRRIERDAQGLPIKLFPFTRANPPRSRFSHAGGARAGRAESHQEQTESSLPTVHSTGSRPRPGRREMIVMNAI